MSRDRPRTIYSVTEHKHLNVPTMGCKAAVPKAHVVGRRRKQRCPPAEKSHIFSHPLFARFDKPFCD